MEKNLLHYKENEKGTIGRKHREVPTTEHKPVHSRDPALD